MGIAEEVEAKGVEYKVRCRLLGDLRDLFCEARRERGLDPYAGPVEPAFIEALDIALESTASEAEQKVADFIFDAAWFGRLDMSLGRAVLFADRIYGLEKRRGAPLTP